MCFRHSSWNIEPWFYGPKHLFTWLCLWFNAPALKNYARFLETLTFGTVARCSLHLRYVHNSATTAAERKFTWNPRPRRGDPCFLRTVIGVPL